MIIKDSNDIDFYLKKMRRCLYRIWYLKKIKKDFSAKIGKRLIIFLTPIHGNLGDHAITLGEINLLGKICNGEQIIVITEKEYAVCKKELQRLVQPDDLIFIQGGGNFGSLYMKMHCARREIINTYKKNKIICFPVSVFYHSNKEGTECLEIDKSIFSEHKNLTIMTRDIYSFALAKRNFTNNKVILSPDCALALPVNINNENRKGVLFVWRRDREKNLPDDALSKILKFLPENTGYQIIDNVLKRKFNLKNNKPAVKKQLEKISEAQIVITDRFHGLLFSIITNTPVIAFASFDTKVVAGIKWFSKLEHVHLVNSTEECCYLTKNYLRGKNVCNNNQHCETLYWRLYKELENAIY